jgi:hypothetical protein
MTLKTFRSSKNGKYFVDEKIIIKKNFWSLKARKYLIYHDNKNYLGAQPMKNILVHYYTKIFKRSRHEKYFADQGNENTFTAYFAKFGFIY